MGRADDDLPIPRQNAEFVCLLIDERFPVLRKAKIQFLFQLDERGGERGG